MIIDKLPIQIKVFDYKLEKSKFEKIQNDNWIKPKGGTWTSSYNKKYISDWIRWCKSEDFYDIDKKIIFKIKPQNNLKIFRIDNIKDCEYLYDKYFFMMGQFPMNTLNKKLLFIDFEKMFNDGFDGINITEDGESFTRFHEKFSLYGWDCESTIWFKWKFEKIEVFARPKSFIL